jgi:hypothetical protein
MEQDKDKEFCVSKMVRFMRVNLRMMWKVAKVFKNMSQVNFLRVSLD